MDEDNALSEPRKANQYLPTLPDEELEPMVSEYIQMGLSSKEMVSFIRDRIDTEVHGVSERSIKRLRSRMKLPSTRSLKLTKEDIYLNVVEIKKMFPNMGARSLQKLLRSNHQQMVSEKVVAELLKEIEPNAVAGRKKQKFKRKQFISTGVSELWSMDQHDKLGKFGLWFHVCVEPFSGYVIWAKVWWTNKNPRLTGGWFIEAIRKYEALPMVTQSDPGSENYGPANIQTFIRQSLDPQLENTIQHRWMRKHQNIKPEIFWSGFRRNFTPGFQTLLEEGDSDHTGIYDPDNDLENLVFRWLAIPWMQAELDVWVQQFNNTQRRASKNKILPKGIPSLIFGHPKVYGHRDFKIHINPESDIIKRAEELWAPPDHPVFQLVPPVFEAEVVTHYSSIGSPIVTSDTFWDTYLSLLASFRAGEGQVNWAQHSLQLNAAFNEPMDLIPGYKQLRAVGYAMRAQDNMEDNVGMDVTDNMMLYSDSEEET